jgi:hypothetical protein
MKRRAFVVVAVFGVVLAVTVVWRFGSRPPFPAAWRGISAGMTRAEVVSAIGTEPQDMRQLKGFDIYTYEPSADEYWQLQLDYADPNESKVSSVIFRYVDQRLGLRNLSQTDPGAEFRERHSE